MTSKLRAGISSVIFLNRAPGKEALKQCKDGVKFYTKELPLFLMHHPNSQFFMDLNTLRKKVEVLSNEKTFAADEDDKFESSSTIGKIMNRHSSPKNYLTFLDYVYLSAHAIRVITLVSLCFVMYRLVYIAYLKGHIAVTNHEFRRLNQELGDIKVLNEEAEKLNKKLNSVLVEKLSPDAVINLMEIQNNLNAIRNAPVNKNTLQVINDLNSKVEKLIKNLELK